MVNSNGNSQNISEISMPSPPYFPFVTFYNTLIPWLETEEIPLRFDRSFWSRKFSGSTGPLLLAGMRFLGLLDGETPQPELYNLVKAKGEQRKACLAGIVKESYKTVDFDTLSRATPNMLNEAISEYGLTGSSLRKAIAFFINACKVADIPISNPLRNKARIRQTKASGATKKSTVRKGNKKTKDNPPPPKGDRKDGDQLQRQIYEVELESKGRVTLTLDVNLFDLSISDRDFVINLVDSVKQYSSVESERKGEEINPDDVPF